MKEITRYGSGLSGQIIETQQGSFVDYDDHAVIVAGLQEQVRALAADNVLVREQSEEVYAAGYNHGHLNTADGIAYAPGTKDDFYPNALQVMAEVETPATDAFIREIRAQAVEDFTDSDLCGQEACGQACAYAARIRSGEQP